MQGDSKRLFKQFNQIVGQGSHTREEAADGGADLGAGAPPLDLVYAAAAARVALVTAHGRGRLLEVREAFLPIATAGMQGLGT